jgi:leucyl aminopeptidase
VIVGDDLLERRLSGRPRRRPRRRPASRAADDRAHLGRPSHPLLAVVGKGVVFDTGGLDIKPSGGMRLMKKDMGGAAHALALARMVMAAGCRCAWWS